MFFVDFIFLFFRKILFKNIISCINNVFFNILFLNLVLDLEIFICLIKFLIDLILCIFKCNLLYLFFVVILKYFFKLLLVLLFFFINFGLIYIVIFL